MEITVIMMEIWIEWQEVLNFLIFREIGTVLCRDLLMLLSYKETLDKLQHFKEEAMTSE